MRTQDPDYQKRVQAIFEKAPFLKNLGLKFAECGPGWCKSFIEIQNYHKQQDRIIHAGVIATIADHSAGGAAVSLLKPDEMVLTLEFKLNLLRPGKGQLLRCTSTILKPGSRFSIAESEVFAQDGDAERLIAKATVTLAVLENPAK